MFTFAFSPLFFAIMACIIYLYKNGKNNSIHLAYVFAISFFTGFLYPISRSLVNNSNDMDEIFFIKSLLVSLTALVINTVIFTIYKRMKQ
ncbi:Microcin E492 immunity protein [Serratia inhibens PRI-2C]|nr:Microcin E492 immunity protein [Serratia inhibens PRI-2C]